MRTSLVKSSALVFALCGLAGCMNARIEESRELPIRIAAGEAVVIIPKPQIEGATAESEFIRCVGRDLASGSSSLAVRDTREFIDDLFPWFEPGTAPARPEAVTQLLEKPAVAARVAASGVRYLIWVDGGTRRTDGGGSLACGVAPGAAGCIGFGWWENESDYEATIWDLQRAQSAGVVGANITGTSAIVGAVVPLPFIARVQGTACKRLSEQLRSFLTGSEAPLG